MLLDMLDGLFGGAGLPILLLIMAVFVVRSAWGGWKAVQGWQVEHERQRLENERQRADVALVTVRPGEIRVARSDLAEVVAAQFRLALANVEMMRLPANVPHSIHYAPHGLAVERPALPGPVHVVEQASVIDAIPSVMECYRRGMFDDPEQLHIGFDQNGRPVFSPVDKTYGVAVAGVPGVGKTTGMRYWALQMALHGGQIAIIDPAANSSSQQGLAADMSGLRSRLWAQPASDPDDIVRMLERIEAMGTARNKGQDASEWPLMLMVDEMTSLVTGERGDEIAALIKRVARQFRKDHIYTMAAGQDWLGDALGDDVGLRRAFVCKAVFRVDPENGRKLMIRKPLIDMVPSLQNGQMVWVDAGVNQSLISVPDCTSADVAAILGNSRPAGSPSHTWKENLPALPMEVDGKPAGSALEVGAEVDGEAVIDTGKLRQIRDYGAQGWSTHKIVNVVFGVNGGRAYKSAREIVNQILNRGE